MGEEKGVKNEENIDSDLLMEYKQLECRQSDE